MISTRNFLSITLLFSGDFNAHHIRWGCKKNNPIGTHLWTHSLNSGTNIIAPPTPTRFGTNSSSTIDLTLVNNFHFQHTIRSISELASDHY
ncbi:hypothetical protein CEXT_362751 [Caerostris extrusa]|uniref:Endonuclease/exonuclease/phosphatase domain-containing protein n=1 Tax=Caerostris extrusa TaxID=172846 RepID=A0AAV4PR59_CAEEX|nr:hypothetical protein CEXT_362751 [Caerostris extrusa]